MVQHPGKGQSDGRGLVIFLPGTWLSPSAWESWRELFDHNGYDSLVGSHHGAAEPPAGRGPTTVGTSLDRLVQNASATFADAKRLPILVGHGVGALIAQVLLALPHQAAIAIAPPPAGWVSHSAAVTLARSRAALGPQPWTSEGLLNPTAFARAYASTVDDSEAAALHHRYVIAGSARPLLRASMTWRDPTSRAAGLRNDHRSRPHRPPLLILSGGKDRLCPEGTALSWTRHGRRRFPDDVTDHHVFIDRGHSLTIDHGWLEVANFCLDWLTSYDL